MAGRSAHRATVRHAYPVGNRPRPEMGTSSGPAQSPQRVWFQLEAGRLVVRRRTESPDGSL
jgi:hypothetical protein